MTQIREYPSARYQPRNMSLLLKTDLIALHIWDLIASQFVCGRQTSSLVITVLSFGMHWHFYSLQYTWEFKISLRFQSKKSVLVQLEPPLDFELVSFFFYECGFLKTFPPRNLNSRSRRYVITLAHQIAIGNLVSYL